MGAGARRERGARDAERGDHKETAHSDSSERTNAPRGRRRRRYVVYFLYLELFCAHPRRPRRLSRVAASDLNGHRRRLKITPQSTARPARGMKPPDANTLRVLIATDTHSAHERDPIRKDDAFLAFEEIFNHAKRYAVDCVLAGDVFDVNKPSRETLVRCMETLGEATRTTRSRLRSSDRGKIFHPYILMRMEGG